MFNQLILATLMVLITAIVHLVGLAVLVRLLKSHSRVFGKLRIMPLTLVLSASIGIIAIHTVEIWLYAALYLALGCFGQFEEALSAMAHFRSRTA